ncbi:hypothetical protein VSH64_00415 [Amycolatopsis rhabdoformis]|uniref:WXG100 family type VII secretion target n=1 Tax=Amycolatopsis rhabdoformis TaxID=1448059 RepID=A0ABZ1I8T9_9PSEU|nr:hypothetical protein [Amycolatopsis rhabdoformis]WSE30609.1 hypothetical protein VSH64_00415 [Amycolatopsis rhabdoformis]
MAVDASGVVSSVLSSYRQVLLEYQRRVTGDPSALTAASQQCTTNASTVTGKATEISQAAKDLHTDWDGAAYTAYAAAAQKSADELTEDGTNLADQGKRLAQAAQLLQWARQALDSVLAQFDQYGAQLTSQAKAANPNAVGAFISAARSLGEQAVAMAKQVADELSEALVQLFPPEGVGRLEHELGKWATGSLSWLNGEPLDGRKRPRTVPSWFGNSGWKKLTWDGLQGTRAPKKADTPFGQPEPETLKDKAFKNTEITYLKTQHEQDGFSPEYDGKITSEGWDAKASGHAQLAALDKSLDGKLEYGVAEAQGKASVFAGGEVSGSAQLGEHGLGVHGNAFVGGKVEGEVSADVAGVGVGANGTLQYGLGAQLDGQAVYDAGHIKVNFKAGVALGLGAGVGAKIDIDLPKLGHTIGEYGGAAVDAVGTAAGQAADYVGHTWDDAVDYVGSW